MKKRSELIVNTVREVATRSTRGSLRNDDDAQEPEVLHRTLYSLTHRAHPGDAIQRGGVSYD